ncbi:choice-of-anchor D domain-containing protein [candidate division KSB1 bacterium]|nr:choice-of-anchor D domain-containing protein [candidate division KSB1 bacterium]
MNPDAKNFLVVLLTLLVLGSIAAPAISQPVYIKDFSSFPAYPYNTVFYKSGSIYVGCGPTTGAMIMGYFHHVEGMSATTGLLFNPMSDELEGLNTAWALHGSAYMNTMPNGFGSVYDIEPGLEGYAEDRGYKIEVMIHVSPTYNPSSMEFQTYGPYGTSWMNDGTFWTVTGGVWGIDANKFCDFVEPKLAAGIAIFLTIDTDLNGEGDHWVALVGINRSTLKYAFYDTYSTSVQWADIYYCGKTPRRDNSISFLRSVEYIGPATIPLNPPKDLVALPDYHDSIPLAWNPPPGTVRSRSPIQKLTEIHGENPPQIQNTASKIEELLTPDRRSIAVTSEEEPSAQALMPAAFLGYNVYRSNSAGGPFTKIANQISRRYFLDLNAGINQVRYYRVTAVYTEGESAPSGVVNAKSKEFGYRIESVAVSTPPVLDGVIGASEWNSAVTKSITYPGKSGTVTLYVMNDASNLYLAVNDGLDHTLNSDDTFGMFFDSNFDHEWPGALPTNEGLLQAYYNNTTTSSLNAFLSVWGWWPDNIHGTSWSTPTGVTQKISAASGNVQYEVAIDLAASFLDTDVDQKIGMLAYVWNGAVSDFDGAWPQQTALKLKPYTTGYGWSYGPFAYATIIPATPAVIKEPDIHANPNSLNHGTVTVGGWQEKTTVISNTGNANLNISSTTITGMNASEFNIRSGGGSFTLTPGATRNIVIRFTPASAGNKNASLRIQSNDPDENPFVIGLSGKGMTESVLIVVDGLKDEFFNQLTGPKDGYLQIKSYAFNDNGIPTSDADLSANIWTAWDKDWFYLYEEVKDDTLRGDGANVWEEDEIELKIDPQPTDSTKTSLFETRLTALGLESPGVILEDNLDGIPDAQKQWVRTIIPGGYALELAIKWDAMSIGGEKISPAVNKIFGLAINQHDNDRNYRQATVQWAAVLLDRVWNTAKYTGTVKFLADNKLQFTPTNNVTGKTNPVPYDGTPFYMRIDGRKDPFYHSLTSPADGYLQIKSYAFNDNGIPTSDADLSAKIWTAWDKDWFYLYEEVRDDTLRGNGANVWEDDEIELKIDPQPTDSTQTSLFETRLTALGLETPGVVLQDNLDGIPDAQKQWVRTTIPGGYVLELAIKWGAMTIGDEKISPSVNKIFGLAINQHDNDRNFRQASIQWAAVLSDRVWNTAKYTGTVKFSGKNKLQFTPTNNVTGKTNPVPYDGTPFYIRIDGRKDPFYHSLAGNGDGHIYIPARAFNNNGAPVNNKDLSALFWAAWDQTYLYVYEEVADDVVSGNHVEHWQVDKMELKIDPDPGKAATTGVVDVSLSALAKEDVDPGYYSGVSNPPDGDFARAKTANGYILELRVKWQDIQVEGRGPITPVINNVFGMAIMNHDNDSNYREASIEWAAVLQDEVWSDPRLHGQVRFLSDNKLKFVAKNAITGQQNAHESWFDPSGVIKVEVAGEQEIPVVEDFNLSQNYPNPFNPETVISYSIVSMAKVRLIIYDVLGREVVTLVDEVKQPGFYSAIFSGSNLSSGIYFYRLEAGTYSRTLKMVVMK